MTRLATFPGLTLLLALLLTGCAPELEESCDRACARPFSLVQQESTVRVAAWKRFPEPHRAQAARVRDEWQATVKAADDAFRPGCIAQCLATGDARGASCRARASSMAAWKRCGGS
jgi:hypothetical protein